MNSHSSLLPDHSGWLCLLHWGACLRDRDPRMLLHAGRNRRRHHLKLSLSAPFMAH